MMEISEQEQCEVSGALVTVLRVLRCAGLAPVRLQPQRGAGTHRTHRMRLHKPLHITASCIMTGINILGICVIFINFGIPFLIKAPISNATPWALLFLANKLTVTALLSVSVCGAQRRMRRLMGIVHYMRQVPTDIGVVQFNIWKVWIVIIVVIGAYATLVYCEYTGGYYSYVYFILHILILFVVAQHAVVNITIYLYVEAMNRKIQEMCFNKNYGVAVQMRRYCIIFKKMVQFYVATSNILLQINKSEGGLTILLFGTEVLGIFLDMFYLISFVEDMDISAIIRHVCWVLTHFGKIIAMIEPCHRLQQEMAKTKALVSQWICRLDMCSELRRELDSITTLFLLPAPSCAPMGLCTLNRSLLAEVTAVMSTLLIIIFQFQLMGPPTGNK